MKENAKKFIKNVKEIGQEAGACVVEFAADTFDYVAEHPMIMPIITVGFLKTLGLGIKLANLSCIDVNKNGADEIFLGDKYTKLNKAMDLQDWFNYLEEMYNCKWNKKKQKAYLRDRGFIE